MSRKKGKRGFLWQSLTLLEMQPGGKLQRISRGQPHACAQHFRLRILRRTRSFPAKVGLLEMQPGGKLQAYLGVVLLQPHACAQHFRFRILRRTRSFPGRTTVRSLPGAIESVWETPSKERGQQSSQRGLQDLAASGDWSGCFFSPLLLVLPHGRA